MIKLRNNISYDIEKAHMTQSVEWKNQLESECDENHTLLYASFNPFQETIDDFLLPDEVVHMFASKLHENKIKDFSFSATIEYTSLSTGELDICKPHLHAIMVIKKTDFKKVEALISKLNENQSGFTEIYLEKLRSISQAIKYNKKQLNRQTNQGIKPLSFRYTSSRLSDLILRKKKGLKDLLDQLHKHLINPLKKVLLKFQNWCLKLLGHKFTDKFSKLKIYSDSS